MPRSYETTVSIRVPGARSLAAVAVATTLAAGLVGARATLEGSGAPTAQAQEAPVVEAMPLAGTPTAEPPQEQTADGMLPEGVISVAGNPATVSDAAQVAQEIAPAIQESPGFVAGDTVVVNADGLNVRTEPGLSGDVAVILPPGLRATVVAGPMVADSFTWYQLDANGVPGWSAGEFLAPAGPILAFAAQAPAAALFPVGTPVVVTDGDLNLRASAGLTGQIQDQLGTGTTATIVAGPTASDGYTWYQLDVNGLSGWSAGEFLTSA
ncbi:MAG: SH3 domain-containing protein [Thermomicrobiales bacterium]